MEARNNLTRWGILLLVITLAVSVPALKLIHYAFSPLQIDASQDSYILVHKGENPNEVTRLLMAEGVISDSKSFIWVGRLGRQWKRIKAGEYKVSPAMSPIEIFAILTSGISAGSSSDDSRRRKYLRDSR